jgi:hypothetical protein
MPSATAVRERCIAVAIVYDFRPVAWGTAWLRGAARWAIVAGDGLLGAIASPAAAVLV